ncbi:MAG: hypothetical protein ACKPHU_35485, partial [Planctomycetaceae bacterium]
MKISSPPQSAHSRTAPAALHWPLLCLLLLAAALHPNTALAQNSATDKPLIDLAPVTEQHQMIPMRDGLK